jgi:hypothetical protein
MPNWVYNTVTITGDTGTLERLIGQLDRPVTTRFNHTDRTSAAPVFSFYNIISPTAEIGDSYYADRDPLDTELGRGSLTVEEWLLTARAESDHWYWWNARNWGTKWDVADDGSGETALHRDSDTQIAYTFTTAWAPPVAALVTLSEQFPDLLLTLRYVEEQGWGGELELRGGDQTILREWEDLDSHAERIDLLGGCYCEDDDEAPYADCPVTLTT